MRRRHGLRTAAHWATCTAFALLFAQWAPFTGLYASFTTALIAGAV